MARTQLKNKVKDLYVDNREFTNRDTGELIEYKRLAVVVDIDGAEEVLDFVPADSLGKAGFTLLRVADDVKNTVDPNKNK